MSDPLARETKRRRRLRAPQRRQQLLDVAARILSERGADALTMAEIAAVAGVGKPVVYRHFPGRSALLLALICDYGEYLFEHARRALESHPDDFEAAVRASLRAYFDCVEEREPGLRHLYASTAGAPDLEQLRLQQRKRHAALHAERLREATGLTLEEAECLAQVLFAAGEAASHLIAVGALDRQQAESLQLEIVFGVVERLARKKRKGVVGDG